LVQHDEAIKAQDRVLMRALETEIKDTKEETAILRQVGLLDN